ncbi:MAG: hypothetical protein Q8J62_05590, partial [Candidatus Cloacimonadaceae bacterium]|nr:hypothetical protein [Candidatus Cloacimonadaceae bacterium]
RNLELSGKLPSDIPVRIEVNMPIGDLVIRQSDHLALLYASSGFGLPGSKLSFPQELKLQDSLAIIRISQNKRGFFTELGSKAELTLDSTRVTHLDIRLNGGELTAKLDKAAPPVSLFLANEKGGVTLFLPRPFTRLLSIQGTPKEVYVAKDIIHSRTLESDSTIPYRIKINQGKVIVK